MPLLVMAAGVGLNRLLPLDDDCITPSNSAHHGASSYNSASPSVSNSHADEVEVPAGPCDTAVGNARVVNNVVKGSGSRDPITADMSDSRSISSSNHIGKRSATAAVVIR